MASNRTFNIDDEQRNMITSAFQSFDYNRDGYIDYFEIRAAAASVGFELAKEDIKAMLESAGELRPYGPPSQRPPQLAKLMLSEAKFADAMEALIANKDPKDDAIRAFKAIDADDKGYITLDDLKRVYANEPDLKATPELMKAMIEEFDMDGTGRITLDIFMSIMFS